MSAQGFANVTKLNKAGDTATGTIVFTGTPPVQIPAGATTGDVLTSDAGGNGTWQVPAAAAAITTETARATAAEGANTTAITAETSRATAAEALKATTVALTAETSRATTAEALLAPKASPALTGTPTVPTATALTSTTQVASTAYADAAVGVEKTRALAAEAALTAPLSGSGTVNVGLIAAYGTATATITVTGAATGHAVILGLPSTWATQINAGVSVDGYVSATNTVTLAFKNLGTAETPPSATVNVKVF